MPNWLPHDCLEFDPIHVTYRLAGSIPQGRVEELVSWRRSKLEALEAELIDLPPAARSSVFRDRQNLIDAKYERQLDLALHETSHGPFYLLDGCVARAVLESWKYLAAAGDVFVYAVCVMGNHVHAVIRAHRIAADAMDLGRLMCRHKSHTARLANQLLGRTGNPFWEADFFDRRIRDGKFMRVMWYVLQNPVAAGLVADWEDWSHTFVHPQLLEMFTGRLPR
ncbi:REP element-mobilizing transposase RayT [Lewinella marina]|nr:transposase [Neolewinella marina]NJB87639.1 REP element-mobilizing transposase RayT [Neolewinella marina]